jgi:hypothetical protein
MDCFPGVAIADTQVVDDVPAGEEADGVRTGVSVHVAGGAYRLLQGHDVGCELLGTVSKPRLPLLPVAGRTPGVQRHEFHAPMLSGMMSGGQVCADTVRDSI